MSSIRIVTYQSSNAPPGQEAAARILHQNRGKLEAHPVIFTGATEEAVAERAQRWWDAELDKAARRATGYRKQAGGAQ